MVINSGGGNKGKHVARKFIKSSAGAGIKTVRVVQDEGEMYAAVVKLFGNCMCKVTCFDGRSRLCIIRKKFTGRRKTDNIVSCGSVVLVGLQVYGTGAGTTTGTGSGGNNNKSNNSDSHLPRCDLLYVYNDQEKEKLRKVCDISKMNAAPTPGGGGGGSDLLLDDDDFIKFVSSGTGVFNKYANQDLRKGLRSVGPSANDEINSQLAVVNNVIDGESWLKDLYPDDDDDESDDDDDDESEGDDGDGSPTDESKPEVACPPKQPQPQHQSRPGPDKSAKYAIINIDDI